MLFFICIILASCKNETEGPTATNEGFNVYSSDSLGFSIEYPDNFEPKENFNQYVPISFFEIITDSVNDRYPENILVNIEPIPTNVVMPFNDFVTAGKTKLKLEIPEIEISNEDSININGIPTGVYTFYRPKEGGADFKSKMFVLVQKDRAINISCTSVEESFSEYVPTFEKIVGSLKSISK